MSDSDLIDLYSGRILELAADIPLAGRLDHPQGSARKRSPLCGSTITVDLNMEDDRITAFGQDVKACALGQAAASVIGAQVVGTTRAAIEKARVQLEAMLKQDGPAPDAPFDELKVLMPARGFKNRHASIMLCLEATCAAMDAAAENTGQN
jgi:NifU-like protein involved in Fe-S cluster formation